MKITNQKGADIRANFYQLQFEELEHREDQWVMPAAFDSAPKMSYKIKNISLPLGKTPQPRNKLCDATLKSSMRGQTVPSEAEGAELCN